MSDEKRPLIQSTGSRGNKIRIGTVNEGSTMAMTAYIQCENCGQQQKMPVPSGVTISTGACPSCGDKDRQNLEVGFRPPDWWDESKTTPPKDPA